MTLLYGAKLLIAAVPFKHWRARLGWTAGSNGGAAARRLAAQVERAGQRLGTGVTCLPKAIALSWLLRRRKINHAVVFAVRPGAEAQLADGLHAWVEAAGERVMGDIPGPWIETLRLGQPTSH